MIVVVVGMHRSGTSVLAGLLHRGGVVMGEDRAFWPRPLPENPAGFYENIRFRRINDRVLQESGYRVKSWNPTIPKARAGYLTRFRTRRLLVTYQRRYADWGWKDPRTALTLGVWLRELERLGWRERVRVVHISRSAGAVAGSMVARGNTSFEAAVRLWTVYNRRALEALDANDVGRLFVTYEALCREPERIVERLAGFLGRPLDPDGARAFVDDRLNHSSPHVGAPSLDPRVARDAEQVAGELTQHLLASQHLGRTEG
jgi:hypothetical protein